MTQLTPKHPILTTNNRQKFFLSRPDLRQNIPVLSSDPAPLRSQNFVYKTKTVSKWWFPTCSLKIPTEKRDKHTGKGLKTDVKCCIICCVGTFLFWNVINYIKSAYTVKRLCFYSRNLTCILDMSYHFCFYSFN